MQETIWKGDKAKELGGGCKLIRSGANKQGRNGVGIVLSKDLNEDLISVSKRSDRVMSITQGEGVERIHGGWETGTMKGNIENTAMAFDLAIVDTIFEKKVNQFVTYNSVGRESHIDFLMFRRCHPK